MILLLVVPSLFLLILVASLVSARYSPGHREKKELAQGIWLFEQNQMEDAFRFFDQKIKNGRKSSMTYLYRGRCNARLDNLNSALFDLTTALSYDNSVVEVYVERGRIYYSLGEIEKAYREFERAFFYSKGRRADILRYKGLTLIEKGQYFQAARFLTKAVELGDEEANLVLMAPPFHNSFGFSKDPYNNY